MAEIKYGWCGKILWVDLATQQTKDIDISDYCEDLIGARGFAIKLAWEHMKPGTKAFDPENLLMFMNGPITGTATFGAGRGYVFGVGACTYPEHFTRSGIGGQWAVGLKACGYDGVVLVNKSAAPVLIEMNDQGVVFHDAMKYWGRGINDMDKMVREDFGHDATGLYIGQAGENLVRLSAIMCDTGHAAGQGGFGAVMGDKKVKGLVFTGTQSATLANYNDILALRKKSLDIWGFTPGPQNIKKISFGGVTSDEAIASGAISYASSVNVACRGCGARCHNTNTYFRGLQGRYLEEVPSSTSKCIDPTTMGWPANTDLERELLLEKLGRTYRWPFDLRGGLELIALTNNYGLNSWEVQTLFLWLTEMEMEGVDMDELLGIEWDVDDPSTLPRLVEMIALRQGCGDWLAEGMALIGEGKTSIGYKDVYKKYSSHAFNGFATHSLGTDCWWYFRYPYWVPVVLQYAIDSRDPISDSGHRYVMLAGQHYAMGPFYYDAATRLYGIDGESAIGPHFNKRKCEYYPDGTIAENEFDDQVYAHKEVVARVNNLRGVIKGLGVFCDRYYPMYADPKNEANDHVGDFDMEAKVLTAITGIEYTTEKLYNTAEKVYNMERAFAVLETGRNKAFDISICDMIQPRGDWTTGKRIDKTRFEGCLDRFYALEGWDADGCPTEETLKKYDLDFCIEALKNR